MRYNEKELHEATHYGNYPVGAKASDLAQITTTERIDNTLLHTAAQFGKYPPNTKAIDLTTVKNSDGNTPLHWAAQFGNLPADTTIALLIKTKNNRGNSALHYCYWGFEQNQPILEKATLIDLLKDTDNKGKSLLEQLSHLPSRLKRMMKKTHCENPQQIKTIAKTLTKEYPIETALWVAEQLEQCQTPTQ